MKEDQSANNENQRQGVASANASGARASAGKETVKRKGEEKRRPKSARLTRSVGQRK